MITSHGYPHQTQAANPPYQSPVESNEDLKEVDDLPGRHDMLTSNSAGDPFSPNFSEEDFDIPPINLPPSALEDQTPQGLPGHQAAMHQQQYGGYHQQHHPQQHMMPPNGMYHHQHQQHPHHHQQQWGQQQYHQHMNGYNHYEHQFGYNYGPMYHHQHQHQQQQQQQQQQQMPQGHGHPQQAAPTSNPVMPGQHSGAAAIPGGPSPVGSHNTPSPQSHSEDGDSEHHARNNNVLKQLSPGEESNHPQHPHAHHHHHHSHHPHPGRPPLMSTGPLQHHHTHSVSATAKKPKVSKRKKKRDPNEPQKPVSAYALFFRDSQASIKAANPNAAFGDVSKIVASMWDGLDPDNKAAYKKRTENAKKDYLKKLAAYRASLVSKGSGDVSAYAPYGYAAYAEAVQNGSLMGGKQGYMHSYMHGQPVPPRPPMQQQQGQQPGQPQPHMHHHHGYLMHNHGQAMHNGMMQGSNVNNAMRGGPQVSPVENMASQHQQTQQQHSPSSHLSSQSNASQQSQNMPGSGTGGSSDDANSNSGGTTGTRTNSNPQARCRRPGCNNPIQRGVDGWNNSDFCSNECVVGQCREVYSSWSAGTNGQQPPPQNQQPQQQQYANAPQVK